MWRGERVKARRKAALEMVERVVSCVRAVAVRDLKPRAAALAEGRVRRVGTVKVESV